MKNDKNAFTMIELVFVIVILGILAAVAIPKMAATRTDAEISKGRADISAIRSSIISERQARLIQGQSSWISKLSTGVITLFDGNNSSELLMYGIAAGTGSGHWQGAVDGLNYTYTISSTVVPFTYNPATGIFTCDTNNADAAIAAMCKTLIN
jgi:general secretion pathway protein G